MDTLQEYGIALILVFQQFSPALDGLMNFFTFLGKIEFYLLIIPLIYWAVDKPLGMRLLLILITTDLISSTFKLLFHQPRPYWLGKVMELGEETTYGIPSSHASESLAIWGYMAYRLRKTWLTTLVILFILFIGISRLYLGVHFPLDVLIGWLIGIIVLWGFVKSESRVVEWAKQQTMQTKLGTGLVLSLTILLIGQLVQKWISGVSDSPEWASFAALARAASYSFTLAGSLFGAISGYTLMERYASFQTRGSWLQLAGRYILGIFGLLLVYYSLDVLFAAITPDETLLGYILRYLRYATVTFLVTFIMPWFFLKTRLAKRKGEEPVQKLIQAAT